MACQGITKEQALKLAEIMTKISAKIGVPKIVKK
jgi:hypothetical protein